MDAASSGTPGPSATPMVYPLSLSNATGTGIPATDVTGTFGEITVPAQLPPITRLSLLFTIEKERTRIEVKMLRIHTHTMITKISYLTLAAIILIAFNAKADDYAWGAINGGTT